MDNDNLDGGSAVAEPTQDQLNQDLFGTEPAPASEPKAQSQNGYSQEQLDQAIQQALKQSLNPIQAELGQLRKFRSEYDKTKTQQQNQPAPEWAQLDEATRKQTKAILKAAWEEDYGTDWKTMKEERQQFNDERQKWQAITQVQRIAGKDWNDEFDDKAGEIIANAQKAANNGDEGAEQFLKEFRETRSGKQVLVDMVRAQLRGSAEAQSQQAQNVQAQARKSASTAVSRPGNSAPPNDLSGAQKIKDPKERLKALQSLMDAQQ